MRAGLLTIGLVAADLDAEYASSFTARPLQPIDGSYPIDYPVQELTSDSFYPMAGETEEYYLIIYTFADNESHLVRVPKRFEDLSLTSESEGLVKILVSFEIDFEAGSIVLEPKNNYDVVNSGGTALRLVVESDRGLQEVSVAREAFELTRRVESTSMEASAASAARLTSDHQAALLKAYLDMNPPVPVDDVKPLERAVDGVCIIESPDSKATGFLLLWKNRTYCVTNHHVVNRPDIAIRTIDGRKFVPLFYEVAQDRDLIRILIRETPPAFSEFASAEIGDEIEVMGNRSGSGVIRMDKGAVIGRAPTVIEVDADFVAGNSGSPVLNEEGALVGVATYLVSAEAESDDWISEGRELTQVRRFATIVDDSIVWLPIDPGLLKGWADQLAAYERFTVELPALLVQLVKDPGRRIRSDAVTDRQLKIWVNEVNRVNMILARYSSMEDKREYLNAEIGSYHYLFKRLAHIIRSQRSWMKTNLASLPEVGYYESQISELNSRYDYLLSGVDYVAQDLIAYWTSVFQ